MREYDWSFADLQGVEGSLDGAVGEVHDHPQPVHLVNDSLQEEYREKLGFMDFTLTIDVLCVLSMAIRYNVQLQ